MVQAIAPKLQKNLKEFMNVLGWKLDEGDKTMGEHGFVFHRVTYGKSSRWGFYFEDENSFAQIHSPTEYAAHAKRIAAHVENLDMIVEASIADTAGWRGFVLPVLRREFSEKPNVGFDTFDGFLNRFAVEIVDPQRKEIDQRVTEFHSLSKAIEPSFRDGKPAVKNTLAWLADRTSPRLLLVKGDAGAGKSVYSLQFARQLIESFENDPRYPLPLVVFFSQGRSASLRDLIALRLQDLGVYMTVTLEAIEFLISRGRILPILDGFDEISRVLASRAVDNIQMLKGSINRSTLGRLILTSRGTFVEQEEIWEELKDACEADNAQVAELAHYSDEQMREWVVSNPPEGALSPVARHWDRIKSKLLEHPALMEVCRLPVYLKMFSEAVAQGRSPNSEYELVAQFCEQMWERERPKRKIHLSNSEYFLAVEAIARMWSDENPRTHADNIAGIEMYIDEYAPEVHQKYCDQFEQIVGDLSIHPMARLNNGMWTFVHDVFGGFFLARALAKTLISGKVDERIWSKSIRPEAWKFLPHAVRELIPDPSRRQEIFSSVLQSAAPGLLVWNLGKALDIGTPKSAFEGRVLSGLIFDRSQDIRGFSFSRARLLRAHFDHVDLSGVDFRGAVFGQVLFCECSPGALFDPMVSVGPEPVVQIIQAGETGILEYAGAEEIGRALAALGETRTEAAADLPTTGAVDAITLILKSLLKANGHTPDFPEPEKLQRRLKGLVVNSWGFQGASAKGLIRVLQPVPDELQELGWIDRNPNRSRSLSVGRKGIEQIRLLAAGIRKINEHPDLQALAKTLQDHLVAQAADQG